MGSYILHDFDNYHLVTTMLHVHLSRQSLHILSYMHAWLANSSMGLWSAIYVVAIHAIVAQYI